MLRSACWAKKTANTRLDRELIELLNELRVALPGVQVLFAFLLPLSRHPAGAEGDRGVTTSESTS